MFFRLYVCIYIYISIYIYVYRERGYRTSMSTTPPRWIAKAHIPEGRAAPRPGIPRCSSNLGPASFGSSELKRESLSPQCLCQDLIKSYRVYMVLDMEAPWKLALHTASSARCPKEEVKQDHGECLGPRRVGFPGGSEGWHPGFMFKPGPNPWAVLCPHVLCDTVYCSMLCYIVLYCVIVYYIEPEPALSMSLSLRFSPGMPGRGPTWHRASSLGPSMVLLFQLGRWLYATISTAIFDTVSSEVSPLRRKIDILIWEVE